MHVSVYSKTFYLQLLLLTIAFALTCYGEGRFCILDFKGAAVLVHEWRQRVRGGDIIHGIG